MLKFFIKSLILGYRNFISPFLLKSCRFYPSCSEYALSCIEKYGILLGLWKTFLRVIKCHPLHPGGVDLP